MKLGILSDTHGYFHPELTRVFAGVDYILHAGDIGLECVIKSLEQIAPVIAVRGNIDGEDFYFTPKIEHRELDGLHFAITHNAGDIVRPAYDLRSRILKPDTDVLVSGHYHGYWCTQIDNGGHQVLWLSPGAAGNSGHHNERTALILTILPKNERSGDLRHDLKLEKIHLGVREFFG